MARVGSQRHKKKLVATALTNSRHFGLKSIKNFGNMFIFRCKKLSALSPTPVENYLYQLSTNDD